MVNHYLCVAVISFEIYDWQLAGTDVVVRVAEGMSGRGNMFVQVIML